MTRIKIKNLPAGMKVSDEELKKVRGGLEYAARYPTTYPIYQPIIPPAPLTPITWGAPQYYSGCPCNKMPSDPVEAGCKKPIAE